MTTLPSTLSKDKVKNTRFSPMSRPLSFGLARQRAVWGREGGGGALKMKLCRNAWVQSEPNPAVIV